MTSVELSEAGLSVGPQRLSRSQDSTQISVPGSFTLGSNRWCFLPCSHFLAGPGRKPCSLSAFVGSGVSTGLLGKGSPLSSAPKSTNPTQPHLSLSPTGVAPVGVVVPLSPSPSRLRERKISKKTIDNAIRWTKAPHFSLFDSWEPHRFPDSPRASEPYPHTSDRFPLSTSQPSRV